MILSHSKKFIFVHINKCGGTTVTKALAPFMGEEDLVLGGTAEGEVLSTHYLKEHGIYKHSTAKEIKRFVGEEVWNSYYKFAVTRNPWDKIVSTYFWFHKTGWGKGGKGDAIRARSFSDYVKSKYLDEIGCYEFLYDQSCQCLVDETFDISDLDFMLGRLSEKFSLPNFRPTIQNKSSHKHYSEYYTDQKVIDIIAEKYRSDIEFFNYSFEKINMPTISIGLNSEEIDLVRKLALKYESEDLHLALKLMRIAKKGRPNGPFISEKINEYEIKIAAASK